MEDRKSMGCRLAKGLPYKRGLCFFGNNISYRWEGDTLLLTCEGSGLTRVALTLDPHSQRYTLRVCVYLFEIHEDASLLEVRRILSSVMHTERSRKYYVGKMLGRDFIVQEYCRTGLAGWQEIWRELDACVTYCAERNQAHVRLMLTRSHSYGQERIAKFFKNYNISLYGSPNPGDGLEEYYGAYGRRWDAMRELLELNINLKTADLSLNSPDLYAYVYQVPRPRANLPDSVRALLAREAGHQAEPAAAAEVVGKASAPSAAAPSKAASKISAKPQTVKQKPFYETDGFLQSVEAYNYKISEGEVTVTSLKRTYTERLSEGMFADLGDLAPICLAIPDTVQRIGARAFASTKAEQIDWVQILDNVKEIGTAAFEGLSGVSMLELRASLTEVKERSFAGTGIRAVRLPETLRAIKSRAFADCTELELAYVPDGCKIAADAFPAHTEVVHDKSAYKQKYDALLAQPKRSERLAAAEEEAAWERALAALEELNRQIASSPSSEPEPPAKAEPAPPIAEEVPVRPDVKSRQFALLMGNYRYAVQGEDEVILQGCRFAEQSMVLPEGVTRILPNAFAGAPSGERTERLSLPSTLQSIGENAFKGLTKLREIAFSENARICEIGDRAFAGCASLKKVFLPRSVKSVRDSAFQNCRSLEHIRVSADCEINAGDLPRGCRIERFE